jgi:hypothetical protein
MTADDQANYTFECCLCLETAEYSLKLKCTVVDDEADYCVDDGEDDDGDEEKQNEEEDDDDAIVVDENDRL